MFDTDKSGAANSRMWRKLGILMERASYEAVERRAFVTAMECARYAEVCNWQATGEGDFASVKDVLPGPASQ